MDNISFERLRSQPSYSAKKNKQLWVNYTTSRPPILSSSSKQCEHRGKSQLIHDGDWCHPLHLVLLRVGRMAGRGLEGWSRLYKRRKRRGGDRLDDRANPRLGKWCADRRWANRLEDRDCLPRRLCVGRVKKRRWLRHGLESRQNHCRAGTRMRAWGCC